MYHSEKVISPPNGMISTTTSPMPHGGKSGAQDRRAWTLIEDEAIITAAQKEGNKNWAKIAEEVTKVSRNGEVRTGKQCRER